MTHRRRAAIATIAALALLTGCASPEVERPETIDLDTITREQARLLASETLQELYTEVGKLHAAGSQDYASLTDWASEEYLSTSAFLVYEIDGYTPEGEPRLIWVRSDDGLLRYPGAVVLSVCTDYTPVRVSHEDSDFTPRAPLGYRAARLQFVPNEDATRLILNRALRTPEDDEAACAEL